jgi:hypothetical protein
MKRITLFFALLVGLGLTSLQAQTCVKSASACSKKSASVATGGKAHCAGSVEAAAKLASLDESIETRTCEKTGSVSYVRKETNPETGAVIFTSVEYNSEMGKFVNVSPSEGKACCKGAKAASCCSGKGKATSAEASSTNQQVKQVSQKGS